MMNDSKRGTGRTTRMLQDAIKKSADGRTIYVIAASNEHRKNLFQMLSRIAPTDWTRSYFRSEVGSIKVEFAGDLFNWELLEIRGADRNCAILVDHYAIESRFSKMLAMLVAYDN